MGEREAVRQEVAEFGLVAIRTFPWCFLLAGGMPVGDQDVGYGPARGFRSSEVSAIAAALKTLDHAALTSRFNTEKMARAEIYPDIWSRLEEEGHNLVRVQGSTKPVPFLDGVHFQRSSRPGSG